jgi:acetyltransferase-like isoleucine patch superfamily enzyme
MISKAITYIKNKIRIRLLKLLQPDMIYGYKNNGVYLKDTRVGSSSCIINTKNFIIGDNVFIGQFNFIEASNGITIEEGCQITNNISIISHSSHNSIRYYGKEYRRHTNLEGYIKGQVHIGKYTFIGPHVTIMPNTSIGKGCIVAAYSMLKGSYPDFSVIEGNPAKVIRSTRERDEKFLADHPELKNYYDQWAK